MKLSKVLLPVLVAALAWRAESRAVVREDVKGIKTLLQDEARDDPFFDNHPQYDFAYRIHDELTGDAKDQKEERIGDAVHGSYSVVDPDGTLRVVTYTADDANGFNAVVHLTPGHSKPIVPPTKPIVQQRVAVAQHHVDVPVPVQHHILPSTSVSSPSPSSSSEQIVGNRRVLVEHPLYQTGALMHQHIIQPPLTLGVHQDVHHLIPQGEYQLHRIHQIPGSGIHSQMSMPLNILQVQDQGSLKSQQQQQDEVAVVQQVPLKQQENLRVTSQGVHQVQQDNQQGLHGLIPQQDNQQVQQGLNTLIQQQDNQQVQQGLNTLIQQQDNQQVQQGLNTLIQQQDNQQVQQGLNTLIQQQDNQQVQQGLNTLIQQQEIQQASSTFLQDRQEQDIAGPALPQVIEVRHSVQSVDFPTQPQQQQQQQQQFQIQQQQQQLRSFESDITSQVFIPRQRTFAVYRTTPSGVQGSNFIRFNSPYAQYTIS